MGGMLYARDILEHRFPEDFLTYACEQEISGSRNFLLISGQPRGR
jgi:hypothetical protein